MPLLAASFVFAVTFSVVMLLYAALTAARREIDRRLKAIRDVRLGLEEEEEDPLSLPFSARVLKPLEAELIGFLARLLPTNVEVALERKLLQAGNPKGLRAASFAAGIAMTALTLALLSVAFSVRAGAGAQRALAMALFAIGLSVVGPLSWLNQAAR